MIKNKQKLVKSHSLTSKLSTIKNHDIDVDVAQLERSNNKCYASAFRYIYIYIYR